MSVSTTPQHCASLHGETAARRQAITELLFFASVGDLYRCTMICKTWGIQPKDRETADYDKRTPLHLAAAEGCHSVAAWLLEECGVEVNPVDRFNRTPLEEAVRGDHGELAQLLIKHGGKVMSRKGELIDLGDSHLTRNLRVFGESLDPEWEIDPKHIKVMDKLGEGEFGVVYKAQYNGTPVAVKVLKDDDAVAVGDFRTELNMLQKVHHPNAVQFLGAVTKQKPFMILTELMEGGSLADMFRQQEYPSIRRAVRIALDAAMCMAYLHNRQPLSIIHRDLKPANLMIGGHHVDNPNHMKLMYHETGVVKIADFGLSKTLKLRNAGLGGEGAPYRRRSTLSLEDGDRQAVTPSPDVKANGDLIKSTNVSITPGTYRMTGETGSYRYMAPEVFRHEPYNNKVDVYAFSMICFQLFNGLPPFWDLDPIHAAQGASDQNKRPDWGPQNRFGHTVPDKLKQLTERCWSPDFNERPEFVEVVAELQAILEELPWEEEKSSAGENSSGCCSIQ